MRRSTALPPLCLTVFAPFLAPLLLPHSARAGACRGPGSFILLPPPDAAGAPLNTRIWVGDGHLADSVLGTPADASLWDAQGRPIDTDVSTLRDNLGSVFVLTPRSPLDPDTTYEIWRTCPAPCQGQRSLSRFTTGAAPDGDPPPVPVESGRRAVHDPGCRSSDCEDRYAPYDFVALTLASSGASLLVLDEDGSAALQPAPAVAGRVAVASEESDIALGAGFPCGGDTWPAAAPGARTAVRYGAFDLAGNFSGWSEPTQVSIPGAGGCAVAPLERPSFPWLLAPIGLLGRGLRHRRRKHRPDGRLRSHPGRTSFCGRSVARRSWTRSHSVVALRWPPCTCTTCASGNLAGGPQAVLRGARALVRGSRA